MLTVTSFDEATADAVLRWRYAPPYQPYTPQRDDWLRLLLPGWGYVALRAADGSLRACGCLGAEAQVRGVVYAPAMLDVGLLVHPAWLGRGVGTQALASLLHYAAVAYPVQPVRATIADWNGAAHRLFARAGFVPVQQATVTGYAPARRVVVVQREPVAPSAPSAPSAPGGQGSVV